MGPRNNKRKKGAKSDDESSQGKVLKPTSSNVKEDESSSDLESRDSDDEVNTDNKVKSLKKTPTVNEDSSSDSDSTKNSAVKKKVHRSQKKREEEVSDSENEENNDNIKTSQGVKKTGKGKKDKDQCSSEIAKKFSAEQKKKLAKKVYKYPALWNTGSALYKDRRQKQISWNLAARAAKMEVGDAKQCWKSIMNAYNYRKPQWKGKSGDPADPDAMDKVSQETEESSQNTLESWEFYDDLHYIINLKPSNETLSNMKDAEGKKKGGHDDKDDDSDGEESETSTDNDSHDTSYGTLPVAPSPAGASAPAKKKNKSNTARSNYDYATKTKNSAKEKNGNNELASAFTTLAKSLTQKAPDAQTLELKYQIQLANLDVYLQKLPSKTANKLLMKWTNEAFQVSEDLDLTP